MERHVIREQTTLTMGRAFEHFMCLPDPLIINS